MTVNWQTGEWWREADGAIIEPVELAHGVIVHAPPKTSRGFAWDWRHYGEFLETMWLLQTGGERPSMWAICVLLDLLNAWDRYMIETYPWVPMRSTDEIPAVAEAKAELREKMAYVLKHYGVFPSVGAGPEVKLLN